MPIPDQPISAFAANLCQPSRKDVLLKQSKREIEALQASLRRVLNAGSGGAECVAAREEALALLGTPLEKPMVHLMQAKEGTSLEYEPKSLTMVKVDGKPFHCECGSNVFFHPGGKPDLYECNACGTQFEGS